VERLKWLSQILKQHARQLEIRGFESFREAVVDESQRMPGPIALPVFAEQAGQGHRRPKLPELRNGYIHLSEFLPMFATKSLFKKSQELGMPVDDVDVDGIGDVLESHDRMSAPIKASAMRCAESHFLAGRPG
jgi:hypothetical protein